MKYELIVKSRHLPKPFTDTFNSEPEARAYGTQLEALLAQGLMPKELAAPRKKVGASSTLHALAEQYRAAVPISQHDDDVLDNVIDHVGARTIDEVMSYKWVEEWVKSLKLERNLAPGTIRKRVGALARMVDWHIRRTTKEGEHPLANPLRLLPKNYSTYNDHDRKVLRADPNKKVKQDTERDRRLLDGEEARILAAANGEKRPDRERPLLMPEREAMIDLFLLIVNTGLRLREAYRLEKDDVKLALNTIAVKRSKTGDARDVPIPPAVKPILQRRVRAVKQGLIFPFWNGRDEDLPRVTARLSKAFGRWFAYAGCEDLTEHDLRHEATCRWVLMEDGEGGWLFRGEEVMRITGHKDPRTFMRYLSLRGSDLAKRMY